MKFKKVTKVLVSTLLLLAIFSTIWQGVVKAADPEKNVTLNVQNRRIIDNEDHGAYALITNANGIRQIFSSSGTNRNTNYFCTNAPIAWNVGQNIDYDTVYNLDTNRETIAGLVPAYANVAGSKYTQIIWLLDQFADGTNYNVTDVLAKIGIVKDEDNNFYYNGEINPDSIFSKKPELLYYGNTSSRIDGYGNTIMTKDLIEVVKQAALWYFTNNGDSHYNFYTTAVPNNWLKYSSDGNNDLNNWPLLAESGTHYTGTEYSGGMLQEQASILYNYLVDNANKAAENNYTSQKGTLVLNYTGTNNQKMVKEGTKYKVGPLKVTTTGNTTITGVEVTSGTSTTAITGVTLQNANGTPINMPTAGIDFYVLVDETKVDGNVTVKVTGKTTTAEKYYRIRATTNNSTAVQGVVEVNPKNDNVNDSITTGEAFDLALRKVITGITDSTGNTISLKNENGYDATRTLDDNHIDKSTIPNTATYKHRKDPIVVSTGNIITYDINVYNEGEIDGYASKITDQLPNGLESTLGTTVTSSNGNIYNVNYDKTNNKITLTIDTTKTIKAIPALGTTLEKDTIKVTCKVVQQASTNENTKYYLTNIAYISEACDNNGNKVDQDRAGSESKPANFPNKNATELNSTNPNNYKGSGDNQSVYSDTNNNIYFAGEEDDDDFEKVVVMPKVFDLALRKFISKVSSDGNFSNATATNREPQVDTSKLKSGSESTAIYNHSKETLYVNKGDYILYTIRVYNEGDIDGYASQITDYLPENIDFVDSTDTYIKSINDKWTYNANTREITTKADTINATTLLKAFDKEKDDGKGSGLSYVDVQLIGRVSKNTQPNQKLTNLAEVTEYKDGNKTTIEKDKDSSPNNLPDSVLDQKTRPDYNGGEDKNTSDNYIPGQEDDDDFEKVAVKNFDLALRKFITKVADKETDSRIPQVSYKDGKITYTHPKDVVKLHVGDTVIYTIRVFNEGSISGYAEEISDDMPEFLEYLPDNETNKEYGWTMYDSNGKETTDVSKATKILTKYLSKANGEALMKAKELNKNPNLLNAFAQNEKISDTNPSHLDVKVAFKVKDPGSNKTVIVNKAQISEDTDENGNPVDDIDSIPDEWNDGEDDQDYENVGVEYFDLALLKYVSKAIVTENGKTTTTNTGNNGSSTDITPKVEINRKRVNTTIVKFEYVIKITNEGDIAGYAKEITDYVPDGLKFYKDDNKGWTDEGNNVISTKLLENTLLQPGQSATVKVILRWVNGSNNLGLKTNTAEISEDYNEKGVPDKDSTPDNKKTGEDDIDDAPVLLTISTGGFGNVAPYIGGALLILVVLGSGVIAIKKYVL